MQAISGRKEVEKEVTGRSFMQYCSAPKERSFVGNGNHIKMEVKYHE
jgi:hypothetical protein